MGDTPLGVNLLLIEDGNELIRDRILELLDKARMPDLPKKAVYYRYYLELPYKTIEGLLDVPVYELRRAAHIGKVKLHDDYWFRKLYEELYGP